MLSVSWPVSKVVSFEALCGHAGGSTIYLLMHTFNIIIPTGFFFKIKIIFCKLQLALFMQVES